MKKLKEMREQRRHTVARRRASMSSTPELTSWADVAITDVALHLRRGEGVSRARESAETLLAILDELCARTEPGVTPR